jgi:hypothetical protein
MKEANITGEDLLFREPEYFSKLELGNLLSQIKSVKKRAGDVFYVSVLLQVYKILISALQRAFYNDLIPENDEIPEINIYGIPLQNFCAQ